MTSVKILVIDDEPNLLKVVTAYLEKEGFTYYTAGDGPSGLKAARIYKPDIILLDIMLPGMDGLEVLANLRRESNAYVIMLTARSEETDKVVGLSMGADDYLTKPFSPRELVARIKAALRRLSQPSSVSDQKVLSFHHVRLETGSRRVWLDESEIILTGIEFDLLTNLAEHRGIVLSREQLLANVWGYEYFGDARVVDVHIGHLRQKIGSDLITTVRGAGYRFEDKAI